jgi:hypothetical protein
VVWQGTNGAVCAAVNGEQWALEGNTSRCVLPATLRNIRERLLLKKSEIPATQQYNLREVVNVLLLAQGKWKNGKGVNTWEWTTETGAVFLIELRDRELILRSNTSYLSSVAIEDREGSVNAEIERVTHQLHKLLSLPRLCA